MSGTRFARTGRGRFLIIIVVGLLLFAIITLFQNSQQRLSETQERQVHCEHQQEALNVRLQDMADQKLNAEKSQQRERDEQLKIIKSLELKMRTQKENFDSEQKDTVLKLDKSQQTLKQLQTEHNRLVGLCELKKNEYSAELTTLRDKLEKQQKLHDSEVKQLNDKHQQLQAEISAKELAPRNGAQKRLSLLEEVVTDYRSHCEYIPRLSAQLNEHINSNEATHKSSAAPMLGLPKPGFAKSFNEQQLIAQNNIDKPQVNEVLKDVGAMPRSSSDSLLKSPAKDEDQHKATELSSKQPPLAAPMHGHALKRKLPENVAPIPDSYADFANAPIKNAAPAAEHEESKDAADVNAAVEVTQKNEEGTNNRYMNVAHDAALKAENMDSGAHEDKDHDEVPQHSLEKDVDAGKADNMLLVGGENYNGNIAAGDEARGKHSGGLFEADNNMNNEVVGDQGKEFVDGLRMEDANEEDEADDPEDDSNPGRFKAIKPEAEAVRN